MKPLYTTEEYTKANLQDLLPLECIECGKTFYKTKSHIHKETNSREYNACSFCSHKCMGPSRMSRVDSVCKQCGALFTRQFSQVRSKNLFCSSSCAAIYNNLHKTTGSRRSKLEVWIEQQLLEKYPEPCFHFNRKDAIGSELDIYIPELKLAFELDGIYHYKPIHGQSKLDQITHNDQCKFRDCIANDIELCVLNVSEIKNFKVHKAEKYFDIICRIIDNSVLTSST